MYVPAETQLLRDAKAAGAAEAMNGDRMLIHQTAAAFNLWTGRDIGLDFVQGRLDEVRSQAPAPAPAAVSAPAGSED
jgi:shikimate dehydrogenase